MAKQKPAGEGTRFKTLENKLEKQGKSKKAAEAIAASIGRKKYGPSDMAKASAAGRKGQVHRMKKGGK
jgi:hypothetical protein